MPNTTDEPTTTHSTVDNKSHNNVDDDDTSYSSGDSAVAFASIDFSGVDFGDEDTAGVVTEGSIDNDVIGKVEETNTDGPNVVMDAAAGRGEEVVIEEPTTTTAMTTARTNVESGDGIKDKSSSMVNQYSTSSLRRMVVNRVHPNNSAVEMDGEDRVAVSIEDFVLSRDCYVPGISNDGKDVDGEDGDTIDKALLSSDDSNESETIRQVRTIARQLAEGKYVDVLCGPTSDSLFSATQPSQSSSFSSTDSGDVTVAQHVRTLVMQYCTNISRCVEVELFAVAALNLFLQVNYTGPSFHDGGLARPGHDSSNGDDVGGGGGSGGEDTKRDVMEAALRLMEGIHPHPVFASRLNASSPTTARATTADIKENEKEEKGEKKKKKDDGDAAAADLVVDVAFQNAVLSELAVDGEWPCPVCQYPYFLLLARSILLTLADPNRPDWSYSTTSIHQQHGGTITTTNNDDDDDDDDDDDKMEFLEPNNRSRLLPDREPSSPSTTHPTTTIFSPPTVRFVTLCHNLTWSNLYSARAGVAHLRLLQAEDLPPTLWKEVRSTFQRCLRTHCRPTTDSPLSSSSCRKYNDDRAARVALEYGLAEHHFDVKGKGKASFRKALAFSGLIVEVTGAEGKRTKYQTKATAQMLVRAQPRIDGKDVEGRLDHNNNNNDTIKTEPSLIKEDEKQPDNSPLSPSTTTTTTPTTQNRIETQMIQHEEDTILLDKIKYESTSDNIHHHLTILHQVILLSLCLDVKNDNPMDGLTAEQMGAFLERILQQHDDWMVYATALLERAWLEAERNHTRQRALLQMQALADQHTNRLTLTQSTFQAAVEDSEPAQGRLRNLHRIVYPPRWAVLRDLAERYAKIGIVTTAAELFEEIQRWDDVVECYRRAGKENRAEEIIRRRLEEDKETPRMWAALGDIKNDPDCYRKALELSNGKYSGAYVALGKYHSDKGELNEARGYFQEAVRLKPLSSHVWFRLGTICMTLKDWELALHAFSQVVQQEPEEADAWANVAAIHMHNRNPAEAYPAIVESLKLNRNNWRVWMSKLYTCMDLKKYDEAIQASMTLIKLRTERNASENIPPLEERVVRALVVGTIKQFEQAQQQKQQQSGSSGDDDVFTTIESSKRTISRVRELLSKVKSSLKNEPWIFETCAYFDGRVGRTDQVVEDLMKEYRALQNISGWETDSVALPRVCGVLSQLSELHIEEGKIESLKKFKFLVNGALRKVQAAYFDLNRLPKEINDLEAILKIIEAQILKM